MSMQPYELSMTCPALEPLEQRLLLSGGAMVQAIDVHEMDGVATANYPMTVSLVFRDGDVADHVTARVGRQLLTTQTDVKVRYGDGSVKHAMVSLVLPSLPAGGQVHVEFLDGGTNANADLMTASELLATDFEALMSLNVGGTPYAVSGRDLLAGLGTPEYWLAGEVASELLIRDFDVNIANQLNVQYYVRTYAGWDGMRIDTVVENCWTQYRGNLTYDFALSLGQAAPTVVDAHTNFTHNFNARWRQTFWLGDAPSQVRVHYDLDYMISTGLIPNYDQSLAIPQTGGSSVAGQYSTWLGKPHDIMQAGIITTYFPTTGGRQEIGPYPTWAVRYLLTMDNRMLEIMLNCGDLSGSIPIHLRESDPTRANYQKIISIDDRPTVWAGRWNYKYTAAADRLPAPVGSTSTVWKVDKAHQASFAYIPYLATGDFYYFEEMNYWAAWNLADEWNTPRQNSVGIIHDQTRGEAWAMRNIADAANLAPDDLFAAEKAYYNHKIANNISFWNATYVASGAYPSVRYWGTSSNWSSDGGRPEASLDPTVRYYTSPWQDDFVLLILGHMKDIGYDTGPVLDWLGESLIQRYRNPDYNWYRGAIYRIATHSWNGATAVPYATWLDVNNAFVDDAGPSWFADIPYLQIATGALSYLTHLNGAQDALDWITSQWYFSGSEPTLAIVPLSNLPPTVNAGPDSAVTLPEAATLYGSASDDGKPTPPGTLTVAWSVVSGPGAVTFTDPDAAATTATFSAVGQYVLRLTADDGDMGEHDDVTITVTAIDGDANGDGIVNVGDLAILASHWEQPVTTWEEADFNDDGVVNAGDLALLAGHWGDTVGGGAAAAAPAEDQTQARGESLPVAEATALSTDADVPVVSAATTSPTGPTGVLAPSAGAAVYRPVEADVPAMPNLADVAAAAGETDAAEDAGHVATMPMPAAGEVDDDLVDVLSLAGLAGPLDI